MDSLDFVCVNTLYRVSCAENAFLSKQACLKCGGWGHRHDPRLLEKSAFPGLSVCTPVLFTHRETTGFPAPPLYINPYKKVTRELNTNRVKQVCPQEARLVSLSPKVIPSLEINISLCFLNNAVPETYICRLLFLHMTAQYFSR